MIIKNAKVYSDGCRFVEKDLIIRDGCAKDDAAIADDDGAALKGVARGIDQCILKDHTKHLVLSLKPFS